jgi:cellobionic acid phosphorylase
MSEPLLRHTDDGRCELLKPLLMPRACGFLFNRKMMMQVNCRGFVTAQHMQPEPAKYAHPPNLEATVFMQPEQPYFAHHPGRFFYVRDEENGALFSLPHEPVRKAAEHLVFSVGPADIRWDIAQAGLAFRLKVSLPADDTVELWSLEVLNQDNRSRRVSIYPFFTIGFMSWMNRAACYEPDLGGIIARSISGYQQLADWDKVRHFKDCTFLLHDTQPDSWEAALEAFEGEGGLHQPDSLKAASLARGDALYETPTAALQFRLDLAPGERRRFRFLFGPATDSAEIALLRERYLTKGSFQRTLESYGRFLDQGKGCLDISTPDGDFSRFVNGWLGRQVFYHGITHRLCTDPQTRNYLQDAMGMVYVQPERCRNAIVQVLTQQEEGGALPDGIRLFADSELKYINQVPHSDHAIWLPVCLQAYLDETNEYALLQEALTDAAGVSGTVFERVGWAMDHLLAQLDERQLSLIKQGDWCDPMNMVGPDGRGVSGWLSMATVHALNLWADICRRSGCTDQAGQMETNSQQIAGAVQKFLWAGDRFARGITDEGRRFGTRDDEQGRLYLNPQSWALMAGIANETQQAALLKAVEQELETPFGPQMLAPAYTRMHEDIGRLTQKFPGSAENGSVYNHAAAFYIHALYLAGRPDHAWSMLQRMLAGPDQEDLLRRGQLPVFIPNYYRGAVELHPRTAGRSSQLFNTGTASWIYRITVEQLFGLKGCLDGLQVRPALPAHWNQASARRRFRGSLLQVNYLREGNEQAIAVNGRALAGDVITGIEAGRTYRVDVRLPESE